MNMYNRTYNVDVERCKSFVQGIKQLQEIECKVDPTLSRHLVFGNFRVSKLMRDGQMHQLGNVLRGDNMNSSARKVGWFVQLYGSIQALLGDFQGLLNQSDTFSVGSLLVPRDRLFEEWLTDESTKRYLSVLSQHIIQLFNHFYDLELEQRVHVTQKVGGSLAKLSYRLQLVLQDKKEVLIDGLCPFLKRFEDVSNSLVALVQPFYYDWVIGEECKGRDVFEHFYNYWLWMGVNVIDFIISVIPTAFGSHIVHWRETGSDMISDLYNAKSVIKLIDCSDVIANQLNGIHAIIGTFPKSDVKSDNGRV